MLKIAILIIGVVALLVNYRRGLLLSSSTIWLAAYILIFIGHPLLTDNFYQHEDEIDVYALIGMIMFCFGSLLSSLVETEQKVNLFKLDQKFPSFDVAFRLYILFLIGFFASLIGSIGRDGVLAVFNGSLTAKKLALDDTINVSLLYITFLHLLFPCTLAMWFTQGGGVEKFKSRICLAGYFLLTIFFGFTRLFLICLLGIILFYQMRYKDRRVQFFVLVIGLFSLFVLLVSMNFIRCLGVGELSSLSDWINFENVLESTDFNASYYYFDSLLSFESPHINPFVWLKAVYAFIPRSIWPLKPEPLSLQVLKYTDPALAATGYSTAGNSVLGEGYAIIGYAGIFLFPLIWGFACTRLDLNYQKRLANRTRISLADFMYYIFAFLIVISAQRGDWSQYTVIILWYFFIPLMIMSIPGKRQFLCRK